MSDLTTAGRPRTVGELSERIESVRHRLSALADEAHALSGSADVTAALLGRGYPTSWAGDTAEDVRRRLSDIAEHAQQGIRSADRAAEALARTGVSPSAPLQGIA